MKFVENIFYDPSIDTKKIEKWVGKLREQKNIKKLHILIIREFDKNLLEIVNTAELLRLDKREAGIYVVGFALDKQEITQFIVTICQRTYENFNTLDKKSIMKELC